MNRLYLLIVCLFFVSAVQADTSPDTPTKLAFVTTKLDQVHPIVGQKITINYQLAVAGFFNGSSGFELPSLSTGRLAKASNFAINGSDFIDGKKYATQLWQVDFFPEQQGVIEIPALHFTVQYMDAQQKKQVTTVVSDSVAMFAYLPDQLTGVKRYIVSSHVVVSDDWSASKAQYLVGDIIQRTLTITADDVKSIQIPAINYNRVEGVKLSVQEAILQDSNNRGEQTATVKQTITYVIKQPGHYAFGGETLDWWDLDKGLQKAQFETKAFTVSGISPLQIKAAVLILILVLLIGAVWFKRRKMPPSLRSQLKKALKRQQWGTFITLLYQKADTGDMLGLLKETQQPSTNEKLLTACYKKHKNATDIENIGHGKLKELIK